ncbi:hypothetical protein ANMWB30_19380 [Arthrobacter sp. MWB30]|nr:hypothetical protein ANMWB30_19380 [Arthrobacter sp. MWB30]
MAAPAARPAVGGGRNAVRLAAVRTFDDGFVHVIEASVSSVVLYSSAGFEAKKRPS